MLLQTRLPKSLWGEIKSIVVYLTNRIPLLLQCGSRMVIE